MATDCAALSSSMPNLAAPTRDERSYTVEALTHVDQAEALAGEWEHLAGEHVFLTPRWLLTWWKYYQAPRANLLLLAVRDGHGTLVGLAPWYQCRTFWGGSEIRFLGTGEVCSDYLSLLAAPGYEQAVVEALVQFVATRLSQVDRIFLEGADQGDRLLPQFAERLRTEYGFATRNLPALGSYRVALPATWDEYVSQLSRSRRQRVRQMWRNQFDSGQARVCVATDEASLERGLAILIDLHQQRQRQLGHPGCFASPRFKSFLRAAAQRHLGTGHLRLQWIELDGTPIAAEFDLLSGNVRMHYCSGIAIDTNFPRPGWLGITAAIRHAIDEGCESFDFLRGDEGYKSHWRGEPVAMVDWEMVPPTGRALVRQQCRDLFQAVKRQVKRVLRRSTKPAPVEE